MAKISANGDREKMRWRGLTGHELVLTERGRLLNKQHKGEGFTLLRRKATESEAGAQAALYGLRRV